MGQFAHIVRALQQFDGTVHVPERFVVELHALIHAAQSEQQFAFFGLLSLLLCQLDGFGTDADAFFVFVQAVEVASCVRTCSFRRGVCCTESLCRARRMYRSLRWYIP